MNLVHAAKQVVKITHDILVGAHEEEPKVIRLQSSIAVLSKRMHRQRVAHIPQVDELVDLAVRITGDIHQRALARRPFTQAADRHDGKQLAERPMIQQRLEHGEVAKILVAEAVLQFANFLGDISLAAEAGHDVPADLPV